MSQKNAKLIRRICNAQGINNPRQQRAFKKYFYGLPAAIKHAFRSRF